MSIASEITRLQGVKADILQTIANKGVTVPAGSALDDCPSLIGSIEQCGSVEIGGRWYRAVKIGNQVWLGENLDYKFSGCTIGGAGAPTTPNAWYYDNDETTYGFRGAKQCGLLYNWYAVKYLNDNKSTLCPGWHVPTNEECTGLRDYIGSSVMGTKCKALNYGWVTSWGGTDDYGFSVIPSGTYGGTFNNIGSNAYLWAVTDRDSDDKGYGFYFLPDRDSYSSGYYDKTNAYCLRLVKDL